MSSPPQKPDITPPTGLVLGGGEGGKEGVVGAQEQQGIGLSRGGGTGPGETGLGVMEVLVV